MADVKIWVGDDVGNEGDINTAANWSPAGVPVATDLVYFRNSSQNCDVGLATWAAVALGSITIDQSFTGEIGTTAAYLQHLSTTVTIGGYTTASRPNGSGLIKLDSGAAVCIIEILNSGTAADSNLPPILLKMNSASAEIHNFAGSCGLAILPTETSTVGTVKTITGSRTTLTSGVTLTTLVNEGIVFLDCAATTVTNSKGTLTTDGAGAITTLNVYNGTVISNSTGTITTLNVDRNKSALVDFLQSTLARTVTTLNLNIGKLYYDPGVVTMTNKIDSDQGVKLTATGV